MVAKIAPRPTYAQLAQEVHQLRKQLTTLTQRVAELEQENARLRRSDGGPTTPSSQLPPWKKTTPKRKRRPRKKPGRPAGHPGTTRPAPGPPDQTITHDERDCPHCHTPLEDLQQCEKTVEEFIPGYTEVHRHTWWEGYCPQCRQQRKRRPGAVPPGAYIGTATLLRAAQLKVETGLSYEKLARVLEQWCGLRLSRGGLAQGLQRLARLVATEVAGLRAALRREPTVYMDETGLPVAGELGWLWVAVNERLAWYQAAPRRNADVVRELLGADYGGRIVCDFYAAYNGLPGRKQRCLWHLLAELQKIFAQQVGRPPTVLVELERWARAALTLKQRAAALAPRTYQEYRRRLEQRLQALIAWPTTSRAARRLQKRVAKHRQELTLFLWEAEVEGTNNRAERAVRPAVVNRKMTGGHRSWAGARALAAVTSIVRTCALQGKDFIEAGLQIIQERLWGVERYVLC